MKKFQNNFSLVFLILFLTISLASFQRRHHHQRQHWDWMASDDQSVEDDANSKENQRIIPRRGERLSFSQNRGKMNAAGFFYISADFPMEESEQHPNPQPEPMFEDLANEDCSMYPNGTFKAP
jgi:hypothetical protein